MNSSKKKKDIKKIRQRYCLPGEIRHITKLKEKRILLDWKKKEDYETENGKDIVELEKKGNY